MKRHLLFVLWLPSAFGATYQVGPTRAFQSLAGLPARKPGDVVEIDAGTYNEVKRWKDPGPLTVRGVGSARPVFDATGKNVGGEMPNPRAVFQIEADDITIENLEFRH